MSTGAWTIEPSEVDRAMVRVDASFVSDLSLRCGPFLVPVAAWVMRGRRAQGIGFLRRLAIVSRRHRMGGTGSVTRDDRLLLASDDRTLVCGQRRQPLGLGAIAVLVETGGRFRPVRLEGCAPAFAKAGLRAQSIDPAVPRERPSS